VTFKGGERAESQQKGKAHFCSRRGAKRGKEEKNAHIKGQSNQKLGQSRKRREKSNRLRRVSLSAQMPAGRPKAVNAMVLQSNGKRAGIEGGLGLN